MKYSEKKYGRNIVLQREISKKNKKLSILNIKNMKIKIQKITVYIILLLIGIFSVIGVTILAQQINSNRREKCINNGGIVIENQYGYFRSCIYE